MAPLQGGFDRPHKLGIASKGLAGGLSGAWPPPPAHRCQRVAGLDPAVGPFGLEVTPQAPHGPECRPVGRQQPRRPSRRPRHGCGVLRRPLVPHASVAAPGQRLGTGRAPAWEGARGEPGAVAQEAGAGGRFDGPREGDIGALVRAGGEGWRAAGRHAPPENGPPAHPTCSVGNHVDGGAGRARDLVAAPLRPPPAAEASNQAATLGRGTPSRSATAWRERAWPRAARDRACTRWRCLGACPCCRRWCKAAALSGIVAVRVRISGLRLRLLAYGRRPPFWIVND
jgi:hypothetical protein